MGETVTGLVTIDVFSDLVCPWCYIGRANLLRALEAESPDLVAPPVQLHWRAYQLAPDTPSGGVGLAEYFQARGADPDQHRQLQARVTEVAAAAGLDLRFDRQERMVNTRLAHRAVAFAATGGLGTEATGQLMAGYFTDGRDIGEIEVVADLLSAVGVDPDELASWLAHDGGEGQVDADLQLGRRLGVRGVPHFVFDGRAELSGAQPVEAFVEALAWVRDPAHREATG